MAAEWIQVSLRAWASGVVIGNDFAKLLRLDPADDFRSEPGANPGQASLIYFVDEVAAAHAGAPEPSDAFAEAIEGRLLRAAQWLETRPNGVFQACRAQGYRLDVFVGSWIDQDQFDLDLPPHFLRACGGADLGITIVTND